MNQILPDNKISNKEYIVYSISNTINNKLYIGVTSKFDTRIKTHERIARLGKEKFPNHFKTFHRAIVKYGFANFKAEKLVKFKDEDSAYDYEIFIIKLLKEDGMTLYNEAPGGKGTGSGDQHPNFGRITPQEVRDKIAKGNLGKKHTEESKAKMSLVQAGENHPMYGKHHTQEAKDKISEAHKGREFSQEHCDAIGKAHRGIKLSEERKKQMSDYMKSKNIVGDKNPNFGNKWSQEQKDHLSNLKKGVPNKTRPLIEKDIREVWELRDKKLSFKKISDITGIAPSPIKRIIYGECYKDLTDKIRGKDV